jgi:exonuclease VII small subunit
MERSFQKQQTSPFHAQPDLLSPQSPFDSFNSGSMQSVSSFDNRNEFASDAVPTQTVSASNQASSWLGQDAMIPQERKILTSASTNLSTNPDIWKSTNGSIASERPAWNLPGPVDDWVKDKAKSAVETVSNGLQEVKENVTETVSKGFQEAKDVAKTVSSGLQEAKKDVSETVGKGFQEAKDVAKTASSGLQEVKKDVSETVSKGFQKAKDVAKTVSNGLQEAKKDVSETVSRGVREVGEKKEEASRWLGEKKEKATRWTEDKVKDVSETVDKAADTVSHTASKGLAKTWDKVSDTASDVGHATSEAWRKTDDWLEEQGTSLSEVGHTALDVAGLVPVIGSVADGANAVWYLAEGDYSNAALSGVGMIPGLGEAAVASKLAVKGSKLLKDGETAVQIANKTDRLLVNGGRAYEVASLPDTAEGAVTAGTDAYQQFAQGNYVQGSLALADMGLSALGVRDGARAVKPRGSSSAFNDGTGEASQSVPSGNPFTNSASISVPSSGNTTRTSPSSSNNSPSIAGARSIQPERQLSSYMPDSAAISPDRAVHPDTAQQINNPNRFAPFIPNRLLAQPVGDGASNSVNQSVDQSVSNPNLTRIPVLAGVTPVQTVSGSTSNKSSLPYSSANSFSNPAELRYNSPSSGTAGRPLASSGNSASSPLNANSNSNNANGEPPLASLQDRAGVWPGRTFPLTSQVSGHGGRQSSGSNNGGGPPIPPNRFTLGGSLDDGDDNGGNGDEYDSNGGLIRSNIDPARASAAPFGERRDRSSPSSDLSSIHSSPNRDELEALLDSPDELDSLDEYAYSEPELPFDVDFRTKPSFDERHPLDVTDKHGWEFEQAKGLAKQRDVDDPRQPKHVRRWFEQEQANRGSNSTKWRNPPGYDYGHHPQDPLNLDRLRLEHSRDNRSRGGRFKR